MNKLQAQKSPRILSPYEKTQLAKYHVPTSAALEFDTTPVEYLTGKVDFYRNTFSITKDTLIPRPESEELIDVALTWTESLEKDYKPVVIEVGTGCGAIAISLARAVSRPIQLIGSEVSALALAVAQRNAVELGDTITEWRLGSLLDFLDPSQQVDLIIANLPYIPSDRIAYLDASVKDHEPHLALDGGPDGLSLIRKLLLQAQSHLTQMGTILLEIDYTHAETLRQEQADHWSIHTWQSTISQCTFAQCWRHQQ